MSAACDLFRLGFEAVGPKRKAATLGEAGYKRKERDFYPTEPWVTRALIAAVEFAPPGIARHEIVVWEPACGDGRMVQEFDKAGYATYASDVADYGYPSARIDFLDGEGLPELPEPVFAIVTNPPFDRSVEFALRALELTREGRGKVALLQRHEWDTARSRHPLFANPPFAAKLALHKRPSWVDQVNAGNEKGARFAFSWYLWDWRHQGPPILRYLPDPDKPDQPSFTTASSPIEGREPGTASNTDTVFRPTESADPDKPLPSEGRLL